MRDLEIRESYSKGLVANGTAGMRMEYVKTIFRGVEDLHQYVRGSSSLIF